jgi:Spy/CpxP family protein refolding chaperone
MKTLILNIAVIFSLAVIAFPAISQPHGRAKERIQMLKKMKLIETLDLTEEQSDDFLVKYNSIEKKIEEARENHEEKSKALNRCLEEEKPEQELKKCLDEFLAANDKIIEAHNERIQEMQKVLTTEQFAKYMLFEQNFERRVRKMIFESMKEGRRGRRSPRDDGFPAGPDGEYEVPYEKPAR